MSMCLHFFDKTGQFEPFDIDDVLTFLKAQKPGFELTIAVDDEMGKFAGFFSEVRQILKNKIDIGYGKRKVCTCLTLIHRGHNNYVLANTCYLYKNDVVVSNHKRV
uniref:CBS domain-containing protein n=1 Tax=Panagrellus redivivus TaxID=6233 RepID=A0A7E4V7D9_PANRE